MDFKFYLLVLLIFVVVGVILNLIQSIVEDTVQVNSSRAVDNYDYIKYFKEDRSRIQRVEQFLVEKQREEYRVKITYTTPSRKKTTYRVMTINLSELNYVKSNPTIVMRPEEKKAYNQVQKEKERAAREDQKKREQAITAKLKAQTNAESSAIREKMRIEQAKAKGQREAELAVKREETRLERDKAKIELEKLKQAAKREKEIQLAKQHNLLLRKQHEYYDKVNEIIDYANIHNEKLIIKSDRDEIDRLVNTVYAEAYKVIKRAKSADSGEWDLFDKFLTDKFNEIKIVTERNIRIQDYYDSPEFAQIKDTCSALMDSQREFNEYIEEKAKSIATVLGSNVVRNETEHIYRNNYFRPYKKTLNPFTAEVSRAVFSSAENNPIEYIIKKFYPNRDTYPEQIQNLQLLIGELETLSDARVIIDNYKKDYQQYLTSVPAYVMENDKDGFYARLGFADISEKALIIEYRFNYTSDGGMIQDTFPVPMTEETITQLIDRLESKLTIEVFSKEQRSLMTPKLRNQIKERDNYTCQECGNSTYQEPNLLLEIDHIRPISRGGTTTESNLQTLCWKCNRAKSNKIT